jgi:hypothetical protein
MKKRYLILLGLLIVSMAVGAKVYAASMDDVIGTYSMKYKDKFWIQGEGTLKDTNSGSCKINADKTFVAIENDDGDTKTYKGKCRVKGNKFIIKETKSLREQIEKKALKPWLKEYVRDQGENIKKIKFKYSKYKITKADITPTDGPDRLKIILNGTVSGNVTGGVGHVVRNFKYKAIVIFGNRTPPGSN